MATDNLNSRERVLKLFNREPIDFIPVFSGMGNVTVHGLKHCGYSFPEIHSDARKMANAAASTYRLFGFECAVAPFDMGVEAEALGCEVNYYSGHQDILYPTIKKHLAEKVSDLDLKLPLDISRAGRIPLVLEALTILKKEIGDEVAIGSWVLGPYTLMGQLVDLSDLSKSAFKKTEMVSQYLDTLAGYLIEITRLYRKAGADYISIREMGAGPDILSPRMFKTLIMPHLKRIFAEIGSPNVNHICGDTNAIIELMAECGADSISVEAKNDLVNTRAKLGNDKLIFGDIDPFGLLVQGKPADIKKAVEQTIQEGVNAVWPGCDLWPDVPAENIKALMSATRKYGKVN